MLRHTTLCATVVLILAMGSTHAQGRNGVCGGLSGNEFGLCNAYCKAQSCYTSENKDTRSCTQLRSNFERLTGMNEMPCDLLFAPTGPQLGLCPCNFAAQSWTDPKQILNSSSLPMCNGTNDACITCTLSPSTPGSSFISLGIKVNLWDNDVSL